METTVLEIDTSHRQVVDLTGAVMSSVPAGATGCCSVFVPHATAGVAAHGDGIGSEADLRAALEQALAP